MAEGIEDFIGDLDRALRRLGYTVKKRGASQWFAEDMRSTEIEKNREELVQRGLEVIDGIAGGLSEDQRTELEEIIRKLMEAAKFE